MILHISGDYPDSHQPRKTKAVSSLVEGVDDVFDQQVYSINRSRPSTSYMLKALLKKPFGPEFEIKLDRHEAEQTTTICYDGLPGGAGMVSTLSHLADRIAEDILRCGIKPDLIHAHKLTIEGLIAERLSAHFGCPYALSIQVNTDRKILKYRPDLRAAYKRIYHGAAVVFPFSIMGQRVCDAVLGARSGPTVVLPCTSSEDQIIAPKIVDPTLASVFHLKDHRNKNVASLIKASASLQERHDTYAFHLYGGGSAEDEQAIDRLVTENRATSFERKGPIAHEGVQSMLNGMCGFAMVSKRETFGMVFLEALLAGCPVVFPKDWAIDGFFDDASFAQGVPAGDLAAIEAAMEKMIIDQQAQKHELAKWQESGRLAMFQRKHVVETYKNAIAETLSAPA